MTDLVNKYIKKIDNKRKPVRIARRLVNSNISIIAANEKEVNILKGNKEWMTRLSRNVRVVTKIYGLLLYRIRITLIDIRNIV